MGALQIQYSDSLTVISGGCYKCGIPFAVPAQHYRQLQDSGDSFWCPNGHRQHFTETTEQRMQKQVDAQRRRAEMAERRAEIERDEAQHQGRRASAFKGNVTKLKGRIANGVCPCCNRSFEDMARHMRTKHPGYDPLNADVS
jgi:hypothetical protein